MINLPQQLVQLWPQAASASAVETDQIILAFTVVTLLLTVPIFIAITYYAMFYPAGRRANRATSEARSSLLEMSWMIIPFLLTLFFFVWAARLFDEHKHPPAGALQISAIGRQWMWKFQHPGGQGEINDLHVPMGEPVLIRMISQDVIHSLYVPALRIQMETLPGRYTEMWFNADKPGSYHLLCSEYCGTDHSVMGGTITIMTPADYEDWLGGNGSRQSLVQAGETLFTAYGCAGCHTPAPTARAPTLAGLYNQPVPMQDGGTVVADDDFLRKKILTPELQPIAGYRHVMPSFKGVLPEDEVIRLVSYIKSIGSETKVSDAAPSKAAMPGTNAKEALP